MKKIIALLYAIVLVSVGCDITDLNENKKQPINVSGNPLFSVAQVNMGNFLEGGGAYRIMSQEWSATSYPTVPNYYINTFSIPNNAWTTLYSDVLINLKNAKEKIQADELLSDSQKKNQLACIQVMDVLAYSELVNIFGDIPYSEALDPENTQPVFDDAQTIYLDLLSSLNTAIENFEPSAKGFGPADVIYNGDIGKWEKFANSLKMRLAITISDVNESEAETAISEASPNAFTSNQDNALIQFQSTPPNTNPVWEALVQSGRKDNLPSQPLVSRMNNLNDPRRAVFFTKYNGEYSGGLYGKSNDYGAYSHFSEIIKEETRPGSILDFDEVEFIRAEAAARGYSINGTAASHYEQGIRADMEFWKVPESEITAYLSQPNVAYASATGNYRQKIGLQKWVALFMEGLQAWTDVRRLDSPELRPSEDAVIDEYIKRFTYPPDAQNLNEENYNQASSAIGGDELTTKLFWDVE